MIDTGTISDTRICYICYPIGDNKISFGITVYKYSVFAGAVNISKGYVSYVAYP